MLKNISGLGKELNKHQQEQITGGCVIEGGPCITYCGSIKVIHRCNNPPNCFG
ncbi:hypothetical protein [Dokdonia sp.]|uniref:hypothetical protein n=1 Tax=Dokdonia sp. TaxID=2024995 RepID=UPI00326529DB